ncbi:MAG: polyprenyl synthetase family protein [Deltaproteobacteria bacterium]|nr:polyprenyl synthetase family protein [Deltaproteobacteria bacterium]
MNVLAELERYKRERWGEVERLIRETVEGWSPPGSLLVEMCAYHLETGGKRLRAMIPLLTAEALESDPARLVPFAAACEMLHNATLVHDDLQDGDETRRGRATVWKRWSEAQAINLGDAMFYYTLALLERLPHSAAERLATADLVLRGTLRVIDGQAREFQLKDDPGPTVERYVAVIEGKTAGLFEIPLGGAARLAGAPSAVVAAVEESARHLGVVFQIQDDLLDLYGEKGRGMRGSDIAEGKISVLVAHALGRCAPADAARLRALLVKPRAETTAADVDEADALFRSCGSARYALSEIERRERIVAGHPGLRAVPRLHALLTGLGDAFLEPIRPLVRELGGEN